MLRHRCAAKGLSALFTLRFARPFGTAADTTSPTETFSRSRAPQLRRLAVVRPDLVDEWVPELNDIDVSSVPSNSIHLVWWRCAACGKNYEATVRDRAVSDKGCPHCHHARANPIATASEHRENTAIGPSLAETHPQLASRWDSERNGLLHPSDVTSESDLCVWWRPAPGRAGDAPFRLPVCAFVAMPFSRPEQMEATAAVEFDALQQIRRAARIAEARASGAFPKESHVLDDFVASGAAAQCSPPCDLIGDDVHRAMELWERRSHAADAHIFPAEGPAVDAAAVVRAQALDVYTRFVEAHRIAKAERQGKPYDSGEAKIPSAVLDADWAQYFALSAEDVAGDRIAESAKLVLFGQTMAEAKGPQPQKSEGAQKEVEGSTHEARARHRMDSLPAPPEEYSGEIYTSFPIRPKYPRRPQTPPNREEALFEEGLLHNTVAQSYTKANGNGSARGDGDRRTFRRPPPHEASFDALSLSAAHSLTEEYATTPEASMPFDVEEKDKQPNTLLGTTAMKSMAEDHVRALQYGRTAPRPRRTGKFRLRMPGDAYGGVASSVTAALSTGKGKDGEVVIEAPGAPRKVARPKKQRSEESAQ